MIIAIDKFFTIYIWRKH